MPTVDRFEEFKMLSELGQRLSERRQSASQAEAWLPRLLIALYAIYAAGMVVATVLGWV